MSESEEMHYLDPSDRLQGYNERTATIREKNTSSGKDSETEKDICDNGHQFQTMSTEIKKIRVELEYQRPMLPMNEHAPKSSSSSSGATQGEGTSSTSGPGIERQYSRNAIRDLNDDRLDSFKNGAVGNPGMPIPAIPPTKAPPGSPLQEHKTNRKSKLERLTSRTKKILAESNFSDDQNTQADLKNGRCNFLLATMLTGVSYYYVFSLMAIVAWSCACSWYLEELRAIQDENPTAKNWITWLDETDVQMIGSLFVFSLVFRFNQCYNRWWQGRMLWGDIIQNCLDFSRKSTLWCLDQEYSDRLNRYIVCFPYAAKAQLRGLSLSDESESGQDLVDRGFLAEEELNFLKENPCWEPEFFLDLMRAMVAKIIMAQWEREPDEQVLLLPHSNRIHDRLFPPLDKAVYDLGNSIGEGVSVRSAGLPRSYDTVHYIFFWIYFLLAPPAEAATIGWMCPIILGFSAGIIMTLMDMGTSMVDPFGTDLVDLPIERFCETIEAQVMTIQRRHATGKIMEFASSAEPGKKFHQVQSTRIQKRAIEIKL